jgi:hypothetical protein
MEPRNNIPAMQQRPHRLAADYHVTTKAAGVEIRPNLISEDLGSLGAAHL